MVAELVGEIIIGNNDMDLNLYNSSVLVTAFSSGIGYAIGKAFLNEGVNLILNGRDSKKLIRVIKTLKPEYRNCSILGFSGDLSTKDGTWSWNLFTRK
jgi:short-subunit dehydrogenase